MIIDAPSKVLIWLKLVSGRVALNKTTKKGWTSKLANYQCDCHGAATKTYWSGRCKTV